MNGRNILITGATGMIGSALSSHLTQSGYQVYALSRSDSAAPFYYDQRNNVVHLSDDIPLHGVINLAGANISDGRWSERRKRLILESRSLTTQALSRAIASARSKPECLLSASAIGFYGDTGDNIVDERSAKGDGFLADVSLQWEEGTSAAEAAGVRVVHMRFGLVLSPTGGVLKNFILPLGLACVGTVGSGKQFMSWVSLDDVLACIHALVKNGEFSGNVNIVSHDPCSNSHFMSVLAETLVRPKLPRLPSSVVRLMFGEMADGALLLSSRVASHRLSELDVDLRHPSLELALTSLLRRS
jgi:uncharacterized protein (TIGR01777 family)